MSTGAYVMLPTMKITQDRLPTPTDFCSFAWAAEKLGVSIRTIDRYTRPADGRPARLAVVEPACGSRESRRHKRMLYVSQVERLREAREVARG